MIRSRRHSPLPALAIWVTITISVVVRVASAPAPVPNAPTVALGDPQGPTFPAAWAADLESVADLAPAPLRPLVVKIARRYQLDPRLLAAVAWVETGGVWNPSLRGSAGEIGLMQVMPGTAGWIARARGEAVPDLSDPNASLDYGAWYLRALLDQAERLHPEDPEAAVWDALAEYNAGPAWRDRAPTAALQYVRRVLELRGKVTTA